MSGPNEKKGERRETDSRTKEFEDTYESLGVEVVTLTTTGTWRVVETDKSSEND